MFEIPTLLNTRDMDIEHLHLTVQKLEMWRSVYYVLIENRLNVYHNKYHLPLEY